MLPDLLQRRSELRGEEVLYRFANGLTIRAEIGSKRDPLRILGLGSPQGALMSHLANFPDVVKAKSVGHSPGRHPWIRDQRKHSYSNKLWRQMLAGGRMGGGLKVEA